MPGRGRLLVIDDDDDLRETIALLLGEEGYDVTDFARARDAISHVEGGSGADAILLDLMMPEMNGWEFCEYRLGSPALAKIPVIVVTARQSYAMPEGVSDILRKPFDAPDLLSVIQRVAPNLAADSNLV